MKTHYKLVRVKNFELDSYVCINSLLPCAKVQNKFPVGNSTFWVDFSNIGSMGLVGAPLNEDSYYPVLMTEGK